MNNYLIKLKHILPFTIGKVVAVVVGYGVLRWLVTVVLGIDTIKQDTWNIHIPLLLTIVLALLPSRRLKIIKEEGSYRGWRIFIEMIIVITTCILLFFSQQYIEQQFSRSVHVEHLAEIDSSNTATYYYIDNIQVNAYVCGHYTESRSFSNRGKETLIFNLYVVYPFVRGGNNWYALKFSERINRTMMDDEQIQHAYQGFLNESQQTLFKYEFNQYHTFRQVPASNDKEGFVEALKKMESTARSPIDIKNALFLEPLPDGIEDKRSGKLAVVFWSFFIGLVMILIALYFAKTDSKMIYKDGRLKKQKQDRALVDFTKAFIIPERHNWTLALITDTILALFLVMTLCGVNPLSPSSKELWQWGALSTEGLVQGEWWRIVSHMFVHAGIVHFLSNIVGLYVGLFFLRMLLDAHRAALIFIVSGVCGGVVSLCLFDTMLVGASGAIMGVYGAAIATSIFYKQETQAAVILFPSLIIVSLTLLFGLMPGVSNTSHITGLLTGAVLGLLLYKQQPANRTQKKSPTAQSEQIIKEEAFVSQMTETIIIKESRAKSLKMLLLMFVVLVALIFGVMEKRSESHSKMVIILNVLSAITLPFGAAGVAMMVWRMLRPRPLMTLTPDGFTFSYGFSRSQFVAWGQVSAISIVDISSNKTICVSVKNREQYLATLSKVQRWIAGLSKSIGYSQPVQISISTAKDYTTEEIAALMRRYLVESDT